MLSHLFGTNYEKKKSIDNLVNLARINRNSAVVIDSDKKTRSSRINNTKSRIKSELNENGKICWITKGREIENYIKDSVIRIAFKSIKCKGS